MFIQEQKKQRIERLDHMHNILLKSSGKDAAKFEEYAKGNRIKLTSKRRAAKKYYIPSERRSVFNKEIHMNFPIFSELQNKKRGAIGIFDLHNQSLLNQKNRRDKLHCSESKAKKGVNKSFECVTRPRTPQDFRKRIQTYGRWYLKSHDFNRKINH